MPTDDASRPDAAVARRLGYLLKHAHLQFARESNAALAAYGITGSECAVLLEIDAREQPSQLDVGRRLGVDRTTMVAIIDVLEDRGLVARRAHPSDRRRNVVELTENGRTTLRAANDAHEKAERRFLSLLSDQDARTFRDALATLVAGKPA
jgi:DNA-binding MarR family transcriptional regulator